MPNRRTGWIRPVGEPKAGHMAHYQIIRVDEGTQAAAGCRDVALQTHFASLLWVAAAAMEPAAVRCISGRHARPSNGRITCAAATASSFQMRCFNGLPPTPSSRKRNVNKQMKLSRGFCCKSMHFPNPSSQCKGGVNAYASCAHVWPHVCASSRLWPPHINQPPSMKLGAVQLPHSQFAECLDDAIAS